MATQSSELDAALLALGRARRSLREDQGRRARLNARRRVRHALLIVGKALDEQYPKIAKPLPTRPRNKRIKLPLGPRMRAAGYDMVSSNALFTLVSLSVPYVVKGKGNSRSVWIRQVFHTLYARARYDDLRLAAKSIKHRRAFEVELMLR